MSETPQTLYVKDETGKAQGPLGFSAVGQLVASGTLKGKVQISVDGFQYADPGRFPNLRDLFPRAM
ncbi:MAG: TIGR02266 family protein, partial [Deltaproteobacteria bacterium]|nr:TIGR02266 family protein [Deltaproteobacteria bacterium]